jgi:hypothetical protein
MRINSRNLAIGVLILLTIVLGIVSLIIASRVGQQPADTSVDSCTLGQTTCQKNSSNENTGYKCTCVAADSDGEYQCSSFDTSACPTETQTNKCPNGINYSGSCGADGCASNQKPLYTCNADNGNVTKGCQTSSDCSGGTNTGGSTTGGSTTGGTTGGSKTVGQACNPGANECQSGLVCTPSEVNGPNVCNVPPTTNACGAGSTCSDYIAFRCDSLTNGECNSNFSGPYSSFSAAKAAAGSCGQVDQVCSGGSPGNHTLCGDFDSFCSGGGTTTGGSTGGTTGGTPRYSCVTSNFTCIQQAGGAYTSASACEAACDAAIVQCGNTCGGSNTCEPGTTCTGGKCVMNGCTTATCTNNCTPLCGGPCDPDSGIACPTGHSCDPTSNRCVIDLCLGNSQCTNNGCFLPATAVISDKADPILFGFLMILIGVFAYKFNLFGRMINLASNTNEFGNLLDAFKYTNYIESTKRGRDKFEKKIEEKLKNEDEG